MQIFIARSLAAICLAFASFAAVQNLKPKRNKNQMQSPTLNLFRFRSKLFKDGRLVQASPELMYIVNKTKEHCWKKCLNISYKRMIIHYNSQNKSPERPQADINCNFLNTQQTRAIVVQIIIMKLLYWIEMYSKDRSCNCQSWPKNQALSSNEN